MDKNKLELREALKQWEQLNAEQERRKKLHGLTYYTPNPMQLKAHQSKADMILYCGGNRAGKCVTRNTLIETPTGEVRAGDLFTHHKEFKVYSWDGTKKIIADAKTPFHKGLHTCYRITMSEGRSIEVADKHRLLMRNNRWMYVDDLIFSLQIRSFFYDSPTKVSEFFRHVLSFLYHRQTNSDIFLSTHDEDVRSFLKKELDCLDGYLTYSHLYDALLPISQETDQSFFPSQVDVLLQLCESLCLDELVNKHTDNLQQSEHHHSTQDAQLLNEALFSEFLFPISYTTSLLSEEPHQIPVPRQYELLQAFLSIPSNELDSYYSPLCSNKIISYSTIGMQEVYDFEVEKYHNYFAGGCIHHNSHFGAAELCMHLLRQYPDWYPEERKYYKPIKAVVVTQEAQTIEKIIEPKIHMFLPNDKVLAGNKGWKRITGGYLNRITMKDGGTVDFLTNEQDDMAFEGHDWDFYWGDEPQKQRKYQAIVRGLVDRHGKGVITFTPLIEPWMKEELVDKVDGKNVDVILSDIRDNKFDIKGNPILSEESIQRFERSLPDDVKETRIHGKFFHLRGQVYPQFCELHKIEFDYTYPDPVIAVLDPHDRQPHHVIWAAIDRDDDIYVHSELSIHCTVDELVGYMRAIEKKNGYRVRRRLIDPNFGRKPLITTGRNMIQEMAFSGMKGWMEADDAKDEGHLKVKDYLYYNQKEKISLTNKPKLYFHKSRCPKTIRSIMNYQYEEWIGKIAGERDPKEKPKDKETHGADCIRYLCMSNPKWSAATRTEGFEENPY